MELYTHTITALAELLKKKEISVVEAVESVYRRIDSVEPRIQPFLTTTKERALLMAQEAQEKIVTDMATFNFQKIACNHCTGLPAVEKMVELGYPVVEGSGRFGSKSKLYVGNGDEVLFA